MSKRLGFFKKKFNFNLLLLLLFLLFLLLAAYIRDQHNATFAPELNHKNYSLRNKNAINNHHENEWHEFLIHSFPVIHIVRKHLRRAHLIITLLAKFSRDSLLLSLNSDFSSFHHQMFILIASFQFFFPSQISSIFLDSCCKRCFK